MSINQAVTQLIETEANKGLGTLSPERTLAIALSRVGGDPQEDQRIVCGTLAELAAADPAVYGQPLHSLVIVGRRLHHLEVEYAGTYAINTATWREVAQNVYGCSLE